MKTVYVFGYILIHVTCFVTALNEAYVLFVFYGGCDCLEAAGTLEMLKGRNKKCGMGLIYWPQEM